MASCAAWCLRALNACPPCLARRWCVEHPNKPSPRRSLIRCVEVASQTVLVTLDSVDLPVNLSGLQIASRAKGATEHVQHLLGHLVLDKVPMATATIPCIGAADVAHVRNSKPIGCRVCPELQLCVTRQTVVCDARSGQDRVAVVECHEELAVGPDLGEPFAMTDRPNTRRQECDVLCCSDRLGRPRFVKINIVPSGRWTQILGVVSTPETAENVD